MASVSKFLDSFLPLSSWLSRQRGAETVLHERGKPGGLWLEHKQQVGGRPPGLGKQRHVSSKRTSWLPPNFAAKEGTYQGTYVTSPA